MLRRGARPGARVERSSEDSEQTGNCNGDITTYAALIWMTLMRMKVEAVVCEKVLRRGAAEIMRAFSPARDWPWFPRGRGLWIWLLVRRWLASCGLRPCGRL